MLTTAGLLAAFVAIGYFARNYSRRTRLIMLGVIMVGIIVLILGK